jgi:hypothetical protein
MSITINDLYDIRKKGLEALYKKLGPLGMVRFLQQYETGEGDYTRERSTWLSHYSAKDILREIKAKRRPRAKGLQMK